jgi:hypothetical protein
MVATAADFLALANPKRGTVDHQGHLIHVREMSVKERNEVLRLIKDSPAMVPAYLVRCCVTDANGKPLFSESDADKLAAAAPAVVDLVATEVMKLSGMNNDPND